MLVKNTLFRSHESDKLVLTLNEEFNNLLTKNIQKSIEKTLLNKFNRNNHWKLNLETPMEVQCHKKKAIKEQQKRKKTEKQFLNDEGLKEIEETFNTKVDLKSIKSLEESSNV